MDLKALIAKMDQIESKKILNEGWDDMVKANKEREKEKGTGKFDKKEIKPGVTQYTRKSSTFDDGGKDSDQKKAEKKSKKNEDFNFKQGGIAHQLLSEFNLAEAPVQNPWANDPEKSAAWAALTPQDQAWLGGADPTDPYILSRAPNKGKAAAPAAASPTAAPVTTAADQDDADMGAAMAANAAASQAKPAAPAIDPKKIARFKELLTKASKQ